MRISKTSLNGCIACFIAAVPIAEHTPALHIAATPMAYLSLIAGIARAYVGFTQSDADTALAHVPGKAEPEVVAAHTVPDDPAAKVVTPQP